MKWFAAVVSTALILTVGIPALAVRFASDSAHAFHSLPTCGSFVENESPLARRDHVEEPIVCRNASYPYRQYNWECGVARYQNGRKYQPSSFTGTLNCLANEPSETCPSNTCSTTRP